jgi:hypothetical protein
MLESFCLILFSVLVKHFTEAEVDRDACWVQLKTMLEVLFGLGHLIEVCKLSSQVNTSSEMRLVEK